MYQVQIEIELYFIPPMDERSPGVGLVKNVTLPVPPMPEMGLVGAGLEMHPFPPGFVIKELSYDIDRSLFLAKAADSTYYDFTLPEISCELRDWLQRGWSRGVIQDYYEQEEEDEGPAPDKTMAELMRELPSTQLPAKHGGSRAKAKQFQECLRGMIRLMVESNNQVSAAYAMDKTGLFVTEENKASLSPREVRKWDNAIEHYPTLTVRKQERWERMVLKYPGLDQIEVDPWTDDE